MSIIKKTISVIILLIILAICFSYFFKKKSVNSTLVSTVTTVTTQKLHYKIIPKTLLSYGNIITPKSVQISAQQAGIITGIYFNAGQNIKKDEPLFHIKISAIDNQIKKLIAQMKQAQSWYERMNKMEHDAPSSISRFNLLKAKLQYQEAKATVEEAKKIENITAPVNGIVSDTNFAVGDFVNAGQILTNLTNKSIIQVRYQLPSQYSDQIKQNQVIQFIPVGNQKVYNGHVTYVSPNLTKTHELTVRADLKKANMLRPNEFGQVIQTINKKRTMLAIPQSLVKNDITGFYVYTLHDNHVQQTYFTPGDILSNGLIPIIKGIKPNTLLITKSTAALYSGERVKVNN